MKTNNEPSIRDIARELGVSSATVSNALRGRGRLSPALAEKIHATAQALGYVPDHAARALRTGKSTTIGLVVPNIESPLFPTFAQAIERAAKQRGLAVLLGDSLGTAAGQDFELKNMLARGVDALIVIPTRGTDIQVESIPVPVAVIDCAATPANTAASDHRDGGRQVARHLVDLGHRKIAILAGPQNSRVARERVGGMREIFDAAGIAPILHHSDPIFDAGEDFGRTLDTTSFTACAAAYDALAVGFMVAASARGIAIPRSVAVTGFDDLMWAKIVSPPLTTVRQDLAAIAEHALAVIAGERDDARIMPVALTIRGSTAPPPTLSPGARTKGSKYAR